MIPYVQFSFYVVQRCQAGLPAAFWRVQYLIYVVGTVAEQQSKQNHSYVGNREGAAAHVRLYLKITLDAESNIEINTKKGGSDQ